MHTSCPTSSKRFGTAAVPRRDPVRGRAARLEAVLKRGVLHVPIHRISQGSGIMLQTTRRSSVWSRSAAGGAWNSVFIFPAPLEPGFFSPGKTPPPPGRGGPRGGAGKKNPPPLGGIPRPPGAPPPPRPPGGWGGGGGGGIAPGGERLAGPGCLVARSRPARLRHRGRAARMRLGNSLVAWSPTWASLMTWQRCDSR